MDQHYTNTGRTSRLSFWIVRQRLPGCHSYWLSPRSDFETDGSGCNSFPVPLTVATSKYINQCYSRTHKRESKINKMMQVILVPQQWQLVLVVITSTSATVEHTKTARGSKINKLKIAQVADWLLLNHQQNFWYCDFKRSLEFANYHFSLVVLS